MTVFTDLLRWVLTFSLSQTRKKAGIRSAAWRRGEYAVIYVTEGLAAGMPQEIEKYKEQLLPAIILIPGIAGNTGAGVRGVKASVEQAVGSDIIFGD